jgi:molybdopterin-guanine dinucleotide biosynthesis protein A
MGQDKGLTVWHQGLSERIRVGCMLKNFCHEVHVSLNENQVDDPAADAVRDYELGIIADREKWKEIGPIGGLASAMESHPDASWLVCACDQPGLNAGLIERLVLNYEDGYIGVCFETHAPASVIQPFPALYTAAFREHVLDGINRSDYSISSIIRRSGSDFLRLSLTDHPEAVQSVDTPEQREAARKRFTPLDHEN